MLSGIAGSCELRVLVSVVLILGRDFKIFFSDLADADIANLDGCLWAGSGTSGVNPVTKKEKTGCKAGFQNINDIMAGIKDSFDTDLTLKNNPVANAYNLGFSILIIYLLYQFTIKKGD